MLPWFLTLHKTSVLDLTHYHTMLHFDALKYIAVENNVRKGEIACKKQFLLFSQCFLPYKPLIFHFKCTLKCRLPFVSIWTSLKFCCLVMGKPFPKQALVFTSLQYKSLKNNARKGEIARNKQFLPFPMFSTLLKSISDIFIKFEIFVCECFRFWRF